MNRVRRIQRIISTLLCTTFLLCMLGGCTSKEVIPKLKDPVSESVQGIEIEKTDASKIEAMLYAMADKFLDAVDLEKLKEEIAMTRLGQMIWEDGREEGRESMLLELIRDGLLTIKDAAIRLSISEEEVKKLLEEKE